MNIDRDGTIAIVSLEETSLLLFLLKLKEAHPGLRKDNLIVNLLSLTSISAKDVLRFLELSRTHRRGNKSFVLLTDSVSYDALPEELLVAPTLQEAKDLIEMEEIERDLER